MAKTLEGLADLSRANNTSYEKNRGIYLQILDDSFELQRQFRLVVTPLRHIPVLSTRQGVETIKIMTKLQRSSHIRPLKSSAVVSIQSHLVSLDGHRNRLLSDRRHQRLNKSRRNNQKGDLKNIMTEGAKCE